MVMLALVCFFSRFHRIAKHQLVRHDNAFDIMNSVDEAKNPFAFLAFLQARWKEKLFALTTEL